MSLLSREAGEGENIQEFDLATDPDGPIDVKVGPTKDENHRLLMASFSATISDELGDSPEPADSTRPTFIDELAPKATESLAPSEEATLTKNGDTLPAPPEVDEALSIFHMQLTSSPLRPSSEEMGESRQERTQFRPRTGNNRETIVPPPM